MQLEDSEKARIQLRETLDELEGSASHRSLILREKERELSQTQAAEKSLVRESYRSVCVCVSVCVYVCVCVYAYVRECGYNN